MCSRHFACLAVAGLAGFFAAGCATYGPTRPPPDAYVGQEHPALDKLKNNQRWLIASTPPAPGQAGISDGLPRQKFTCSFIEFDERGDYLDFQQHLDAMGWIRELTKPGTRPLLLVIYCHGWMNNAQSDDVVRFNDFLDRLGIAWGDQYTVHGVYLAWRGDSLTSLIHPNRSEFKRMAADFPTDPNLIDPAKNFTNPWLAAPLWPFRALSFYFRKSVAETSASGVPMARTVFTIADTVRENQKDNAKIYVIGHSFGALMLEKTLGQACISRLTARYSQEDFNRQNKSSPPNPLPFNCLLFVNSAAPSLYAKELSDLFWAYSMRWNGEDNVADWLDRSKWPPTIPAVVSVTSDGDKATSFWSPVGTRISTATISLWQLFTFKHYYARALLWHRGDSGAGDKYANPDANFSLPHEPVPQQYFYFLTPGHNPLLVDHWIVPVKGNELHGLRSKWPFDPATMRKSQEQDHGPEGVMGHNRDAVPEAPYAPQPNVFYFDTVTRWKKGDKAPPELETWKIMDRLEAEKLAAANPSTDSGSAAAKVHQWSLSYSGQKGVEPFPRPSLYWIVRCDRGLIADHGDIWGDKAMAFYSALFDHIDRMRTPRDPAKPAPAAQSTR